MALTKRYTVVPSWERRAVIIIGGGPSFDLAQNRLIARARNRAESPFRVIAVNDAVYGAFWADWLHACDSAWWFRHIQGVHEFQGIKTTIQDDVPAPWVSGFLQQTGVDGFDPDPSCCRTGNNSAYQAMHIAIHAGASRIILCGIDMKDGDGGKKHWFGNHDDITGEVPVYYEKIMVPHFETLKPELERRGIEVINTSMGSALTAFPKAPLESVLKF